MNVSGLNTNSWFEQVSVWFQHNISFMQSLISPKTYFVV